MIHIRKIKTLYGLRYAVVEPFVYYKTITDKTQKIVEYVKMNTYHAVEYKENKKIKVAIFEVSKDGLERAKAVQDAFRKGKNTI